MERVNPYLNDIAFYLVLLFAAVLILSNALAETIALVILVIWIAQTIAYRRKSWTNYPLFKPLCALIGFKLIVLLVSGYQGSFGSPFEQLTLPLLYFIVPAIVVTSERRRNVLWLLITGAVLASGIGIIKYFSGTESRISSIVSGYYTLAGFLTVILGLVLSMFVFTKRTGEKCFLGLVSFPLIAGIIFTFVRTCYFIVCLFVLLLGIFKDRKLLIPVVIVILLLLIFSPQTINTVSQRFDFSSKDVLSERDILLHKGLSKVEDVGFFGYGINSFPSLYDVLADPDVKDKSINTWHNMYLEFLLDGGPVLLLILLWMLIAQTRYSLAIYRKTQREEQKTYQLGILLFILFLVVVGFFANPLRDPIMSMLTWLVLGLSLI
jgi:O-antigen ligase